MLSSIFIQVIINVSLINNVNVQNLYFYYVLIVLSGLQAPICI